MTYKEATSQAQRMAAAAGYPILVVVTDAGEFFPRFDSVREPGEDPAIYVGADGLRGAS